MKARRGGPLWSRLNVSVALGLLLGCVYTAIDVYIDHFVGAELEPSAHPIQLLHAIIDLVLPALTGALLGAVLHFVGVRERMAAFEKQRADELAGHLHKIERHQAAWVISASLLHELKNPLHTLGLLLDEVTELPDSAAAERTRLLERARAQSGRIEQRLLALRSLEATGPPELPELELASCISRLLEPLTQLAERKNVSIDLAGGPVLARVDPSYMRVILENLIENALDALNDVDGGRIELRLEQRESDVVVTLQDTGPGLSEEMRKNAFEPLVSQKSRGLGLGLSIARGLARSMGGELTSLPSEEGACFELRLRRGEA
jgi:two-component system C4-dicarboxylate transport sensor histidine kinase DctB